MPKGTDKSSPKSASKLAKAEVRRSAPIDALLAGIADTTTKTADRQAFADLMVEISTVWTY
jgi:hypothetical protein